MNWYWARGETREGPISNESLQRLIREGVVQPGTLVWREGMEEWESLEKAAPHLLLPTSPELSSASAEESPRGSDGELRRLLDVARAQRGVILCIMATLCLWVVILVIGLLRSREGVRGEVPALWQWPLTAAFLVIAVIEIFWVYRLASALGSEVPIVWAAGVSCLGCFGLLLLLILSSRASRQLQNAGFFVGLTGADIGEIRERLRGESGEHGET